MADINTDNADGKFIFGQNMEDRALKPPDTAEAEGEDAQKNGVTSSSEINRSEEDGSAVATPGGDKPLLRPSAFASPAQGQVGSSISNNPFAARVAQSTYSESDEEKREKPIVAPSHFTVGGGFGARGFGFGMKSSPASSKLLLRPSALDKQTANFNKENSSPGDFRTSFKLEPAKLQNPFSKTEADGDEEPGSPEKTLEEPSEPETKPEEPVPDPTPPSDVNERLQATNDNPNTVSNTCNSPPSNAGFVPLAGPTSSSAFLFGQNMQHRVMGAQNNGDSSEALIFGQNMGSRFSSPQKTPLPQSAEDEDIGKNGETEEDAGNADNKPASLVESAAAYEARLAKPEFDEVEVRTGEEDESNVFQINVKLFLFDKENQSWLERGRGQLRLNDQCFFNSTAFQSRLVMRTQGSLRVVLNTKIWPGMLVEMASEKTVRITAVDQDEGVKIYLIMANRSDITHIYSAINSRVQQLKAEEATLSSEDTAAPSSGSLPTVCTTDLVSSSQPEKRPAETPSPEEQPSKRTKMARHHKASEMVKGTEHPREMTEESNDSSTVDPETEASNESCASSPIFKSSSSD